MQLHARPFQPSKGRSSAGARTVVCRSAAQQQAVAAQPNGNPLLFAAVEMLFRFPPFFSMASKKARTMIVERAEKMGMDWSGAMTQLKAQDWNARMAAVTNPSVSYPSYYTQPFHAYTQGNLCWEAALEVTLAAKSVHATVMDTDGKTLDPEGDHKLRSNYSKRMKECLAALGVPTTGIKSIVDLGCATGLSSLELLDAFPGAHVTGIDLSPHFLAVGKYEQEQRMASSGKPESLTFVHGLAESTGLPSGSVDMVSCCLVMHELPQAATAAIMREAYRVLRPGGAMCIMEMNPRTPAFQRIFKNPFAYTAFKSTEPWLMEYIALDMDAELHAAGFSAIKQGENTPRHKTVVALKQ